MWTTRICIRVLAIPKTEFTSCCDMTWSFSLTNSIKVQESLKYIEHGLYNVNRQMKHHIQFDIPSISSRNGLLNATSTGRVKEIHIICLSGATSRTSWTL